MSRLISDPRLVAEPLGRDPIGEMLLPSLMLEGPRWAAPLLWEEGGRRVLICRDIERANVVAAGPAVQVVYYEPYFQVAGDGAVDAVHADLAAAIEHLADGAPVEVDAALPYGHALALGDRLRVPVDVSYEAREVVVTQVARGQVAARFAAHALDARQAAGRIIADRSELDRLSVELGFGDTRFRGLDRSLDALDADAVLVGSIVNGQQLLGSVAPPGSLLLATKEGAAVHLIAPGASPAVRDGTRFASCADAIAALMDGRSRLAVEELQLATSVALALRGREIELIPASVALSRWREARAHENLACTIVAAQASRWAIEGSVSYLSERLSAAVPTRESDVVRRYRALLAEFRRRYDVPFAIGAYFTNVHSGDRSARPALPTDAPIAAEATVKFDAGVHVHASGLLLASSDVARSRPGSRAGAAALELFGRIVRKEVLPALRPGQTGGQVHARVTEALDLHRGELEAVDLHPGDGWRATRDFRRDVGHLMSTQESLLTQFAPGASERLHAGAVVAVEIQWAYGRHALAWEDMALVTAAGGRLLSA